MKIVIDGRCISASLRGVGYYLVNSLAAFADLCPKWQFVIISNKSIDGVAKDILLQKKNIFILVEPLTFFPNKGVFWFIFKLPIIIKRLKADLFWAPGTWLPFFMPKGIKTLVTVHDLVHKKYKSTMSLRNKYASSLFVDKSIISADIIWAVSNYTADEVKKFYPRRKSKKILVGSSIDMDFYHKISIPDKESSLIYRKLNLDINKKMLLFVGTLEPRKNLKFLLSLMPILSSKGYEVVIVGGQGWGKTEISSILKDPKYPSHSVHFAGYLTNQELRILYNLCDCFISTSLNEGFGLPQLEAISCGAIVVTADNSAMTEVVDNVGILVKGWNIEEWVNSIEYAITNKEKLQGNYQVKLNQYKWKNILTPIIQCIESEVYN